MKPFYLTLEKSFYLTLEKSCKIIKEHCLKIGNFRNFRICYLLKALNVPVNPRV